MISRRFLFSVAAAAPIAAAAAGSKHRIERELMELMISPDKAAIDA